MKMLPALFVLLGLVSELTEARHVRHFRRSKGTGRTVGFPTTECVATLKRSDNTDDKMIKWYMPWEVTDHNWQQRWPAGSTGSVSATLYEGDGKGCRVEFMVDLETCSFDGKAYGIEYSGLELCVSSLSD